MIARHACHRQPPAAGVGQGAQGAGAALVESRRAGAGRGVASSLQLSLENEKLKDAQDAYLKVLLKGARRSDDVVGYVFAINGKLNSAEVYPSNGLFRKMWPKLLKASVTEAIGQKNSAATDPAPSGDAALAFLNEPRRARRAKRRFPPASGSKRGRPRTRSISRRGARTAPSCIAAIWRNSNGCSPPAHRGDPRWAFLRSGRGLSSQDPLV